jgi:hypothetical protein
LVPQTVAEEDIQGAQALGGVSREVASFASPALATALVLGVGGAVAFGLDAATFLISAAILSRVRARSRGEAGERATVVRELREGWRAVRERSWVWGTIAAFSAALLVALAPFFVLGAAVAEKVYGTEAVFGLTNAAWGVGTVTGALIGARWRPQRPMLTGMLAAIPWPGAIALFGAGPPLGVLVGNRIGAADPAALVVPGVRVGLDGFAGVASRWLPARGADCARPRRCAGHDRWRLDRHDRMHSRSATARHSDPGTA